MISRRWRLTEWSFIEGEHIITVEARFSDVGEAERFLLELKRRALQQPIARCWKLHECHEDAP